LIAPGGSEVVQILLVEKDKTQLLQSYSTMGDAALEQCRDKFLVQSIAVDASSSEKLSQYEELTSFWTTMTSNKNPGIANKKLQVKHKVADGGTGGTGAASPAANRHHQLPIENMSGSEMAAELTSLRTKYDELVSFSVNLTAERDLLNNALEQTKRDLQLATGGNGNMKSSLKKGSATIAANNKTSSSSSSGTVLAVVVLLTMTAGIVAGAKLHQLGLLRQVPILGDHLYGTDEL
jgi:hypothetical protein